MQAPILQGNEIAESSLCALGNKIALRKLVDIKLVAIAGFKFRKQPFPFGLCPETMIEVGLRPALYRRFVGQLNQHVVQLVVRNTRAQHLIDKGFEVFSKRADQIGFLGGC